MSSVRSVTAAHQITSHAGSSPRAAGAPFHVGRGSPGQTALPSPGRISGPYSSFLPPGGLAPVYIATMVLLCRLPRHMIAKSRTSGPANAPGRGRWKPLLHNLRQETRLQVFQLPGR